MPQRRSHMLQRRPSAAKINKYIKIHIKGLPWWHSGYESACRASLVAQWLRIHLPMQGKRVRALVQEDTTCHGATKPVRRNYWACALEPMSHNYWSPCTTTTEAHAPRAHAPQQEKPPQWEACAPQQRVAPTPATRESPHAATKTKCSHK